MKSVCVLSPPPQLPVPVLIRELEERLPVLRLGVRAGCMDELTEQAIAALREVETLRTRVRDLEAQSRD